MTYKYNYNKDTTWLIITRYMYDDNTDLISHDLLKMNNNDFYISKNYYYDMQQRIIKAEALDRKGTIIYSYLYEYDDKNYIKTSYLQNDDGKREESKHLYNNIKQCVKVKNFLKFSGMYSGEEIREDNYIYNIDGTLFEWSVYTNGKLKQLNRHYYFKN